jgi:hypothetical protein
MVSTAFGAIGSSPEISRINRLPRRYLLAALPPDRVLARAFIRLHCDPFAKETTGTGPALADRPPAGPGCTRGEVGRLARDRPRSYNFLLVSCFFLSSKKTGSVVGICFGSK